MEASVASAVVTAGDGGFAYFSTSELTMVSSNISKASAGERGGGLFLSVGAITGSRLDNCEAKVGNDRCEWEWR